jgi:O-antigen ligase
MASVAPPNLFSGGPNSAADWLVFAGLAVALAVCPVVFWPGLYDDFTLLKQASLLLAAALALTGFAVGGVPLPRSRVFQGGLAAWVAALLLSAAFGSDPVGGLLGVYQYREGLLTQLCYVVLLLAGMRAATAGWSREALLFPGVGLSGALLYTGVQATGNDPIDWWTDTSVRAIGTIGNANELASYAVISLAVLAAFAHRQGVAAWLATAGLFAAAVFIVLESESRSGVIGLGCFGVALALAWMLGRQPLRLLRRPALALAAGLAFGMALSAFAGSFAGTADRVVTPDRGMATRISLWKGTVEAIEASPVVGHGPDGLWLPFMEHRPDGLRGTFEVYDLTAQSSHNLLLDTLANTGVLGLAALGILVALALWRSVSAQRAEPHPDGMTPEFMWAAIAGYGAMTFLNPVSLAPHALFFVLLGIAAGTPDPAASDAARPSARSPRRWAPATACLVLASVVLAVAVALPLADLQAERGWNAYAAGDFERAGERYGDASRTMPVDRQYATRHADALLAAAVADPSRAADAVEAYERLDTRFGLSSDDAFNAAASLFATGAAPAMVEAMVERAVRLNPRGIEVHERASQLRAAIAGGGTLEYSWSQRRVFVRPAAP